MLPAIERCVGDPRRFAREVWAKEPHHRPGADAGAWGDVLSLDEVDRWIGTGGLRHPALRIVRDGKTVPRSSYLRAQTTGGKRIRDAVDPEATLAAFAEGATLVLQGLHRWSLNVQRFCAELEGFFGHSLQANAYLTPAGARGLAVHHDTHDVLVLQLHGAKRWSLYETPVPYPVSGHPASKRHRDPGEPRATLEVRAGDCLYLPRGVPHQAEGLGEVSLHLTLGVRRPTWLDVVERVMKRAKEIPALRAPLPLDHGTHPGALEAELGEVLKKTGQWLAELDPVPIAAAEVERVRTARAPEAVGRLRAIAGVDAITLETELRRATEVPWRLEPERSADGGDQAVLHAGKAALRFPGRVAPALHSILEMDTVRAADLVDPLDESGALVLVRRLHREGFLRLPRERGE